MSTDLARLHARYLASREAGWPAVEANAAAAAYRERAIAICSGPPFAHSLMRVERSPMATGHRGSVHIVPAERINSGKLHRVPGQSLCRGPHGFAGRLSELAPVEEGAKCYACLVIAEAHTIVGWQAS